MKAHGCLLLVLLFGCGASHSSDDDDAAEADTHDASTLEGFMDALCAAEAPCCVDGGYSESPAECLAFLRAATEGATYDAAQGKDCIAWLRQASHDYAICADDDSAPSSCAAVLRSTKGGTRQPGETCSTPADCAASPEGDVDCHYDFLPSGTTQTCQVQIPGHVGDAPCLGTRDGMGTSSLVFEDGAPPRGYVCDLRDGVYCNGTACAAAGTVGAPCDEARLCNQSSYCDGGNEGTAACVARRALGAACDWDGQCAGGSFCNAGFCGQLLAAGAPCTDSSQCASSICSSGSCFENDDGAGLELICVPK